MVVFIVLVLVMKVVVLVMKVLVVLVMGVIRSVSSIVLFAMAVPTTKPTQKINIMF